MKRIASRALSCLSILVLLALGCSNDPYPPGDADEKVYYSSFTDPPRTLDPAEAYSSRAHAVTGAVYDTLLKYHYLKRPLELIPGLAEDLPEVTQLGEGREHYRFQIRQDLLFHDDPCFELGGAGRLTREIVAEDFAFELTRLADPEVNSPVIEPFSNIDGFSAFSKALAERRKADEDFAGLPAHEQYAAIGGIRGIRTPTPYVLEVSLSTAYPQIKYWFATEFSAPIPWEAIASLFFSGPLRRAA